MSLLSFTKIFLSKICKSLSSQQEKKKSAQAGYVFSRIYFSHIYLFCRSSPCLRVSPDGCVECWRYQEDLLNSAASARGLCTRHLSSCSTGWKTIMHYTEHGKYLLLSLPRFHFCSGSQKVFHASNETLLERRGEVSDLILFLFSDTDERTSCRLNPTWHKLLNNMDEFWL